MSWLGWCSLPDLTRVVNWWRDERSDEIQPGVEGGDPLRASRPSGSSLVRPSDGFVAGGGSTARAGSATRGVASGPTRDPRRAYRVVDDFEAELAFYTGAPFAVAVDSCTNSILLALYYVRAVGFPRHHPAKGPGSGYDGTVKIPRRTYVGVLQAALNAGWTITWSDDEWQQDYFLHPTCVLDSARRIAPGMYLPGTFTCLSFHAAKQLPLGRGGAIDRKSVV